MNSFLKWLAGNSLIRAQILGVARHIASSIAGAVGLWLARHGADQSTTADATQGIILLLSAAASYGFSVWDKSNVQAKNEASTEAGKIIAGAPPNPQLVVDQAKADNVAAAIKQAADTAPSDKAAALARLRSGT
jgi:hypothetical protein